MHGDDQEDELVEFVNDELFHLEGLAKLGRDDKGRMTLKAKIFFSNSRNNPLRHQISAVGHYSHSMVPGGLWVIS